MSFSTFTVGGCCGQLMLLWKKMLSLSQISRTIFKPNPTCIHIFIFQSKFIESMSIWDNLYYVKSRRGKRTGKKDLALSCCTMFLVVCISSVTALGLCVSKRSYSLKKIFPFYFRVSYLHTTRFLEKKCRYTRQSQKYIWTIL